jgi:hypothetical protein
MRVGERPGGTEDVKSSLSPPIMAATMAAAVSCDAWLSWCSADPWDGEPSGGVSSGMVKGKKGALCHDSGLSCGGKGAAAVGVCGEEVCEERAGWVKGGSGGAEGGSTGRCRKGRRDELLGVRGRGGSGEGEP